MDNKTQGVIVVAVLVVLWVGMRSQADIQPPPDTPVPYDAPDFRPVFAANPDRAAARDHAARLAELCSHVAHMVEFDATAAAGSKLTTEDKLEDLRINMRHYLEAGGSYGALYPSLGRTIADYLSAKVTPDDSEAKPLTAERRTQWTAALRGLSAALHAAAQEI